MIGEEDLAITKCMLLGVEFSDVSPMTGHRGTYWSARGHNTLAFASDRVEVARKWLELFEDQRKLVEDLTK